MIEKGGNGEERGNERIGEITVKRRILTEYTLWITLIKKEAEEEEEDKYDEGRKG